jgi:hypothetical protein
MATARLEMATKTTILTLRDIEKPPNTVWTSLSGASTICTACGSRTCNSPQPVADHDAHALGPASPRRTAHISSTQTALKERRRGRLTSVWPWVGDIRPSPTLRGDR